MLKIRQYLTLCKATILSVIISFLFFIHCYLEMLQHLWSYLGSLDVYQKAVHFYCCVVNVSFVKFTDFNFYDIEFDE